MLDDLLIQFFDAQARRATSVYLLLIGKKTLSILYAALIHDQLQWFQLYPTLQREDYQAAIARLQAQGLLIEAADGLVLADETAKQAAAARLPLPDNYQPALGVGEFGAKFQLAVQVLSEASYQQSRYRPAVRDWAIQQAVRQWWRQVDAEAARTQLTKVFARLPEAVADAIAQRLIGHDYVGAALPATLAAQLTRLDQEALLAMAVAEESQAPIWQRLWGGVKPLGTPSAYQVLAAINQGQSKAQVAAQLHLKLSTVNEHLLTLAIEGQTLPLGSLYPPAIAQALTSLQPTDYRQLLAAVPGSDFFQVRLFQILRFQGRWPDADA